VNIIILIFFFLLNMYYLYLCICTSAKCMSVELKVYLFIWSHNFRFSMSLSLSPSLLYRQTTDCTEGGGLTREHCILRLIRRVHQFEKRNWNKQNILRRDILYVTLCFCIINLFIILIVCNCQMKSITNYVYIILSIVWLPTL
jgi:hypothetical protein